jgi:hypothetical protein
MKPFLGVAGVLLIGLSGGFGQTSRPQDDKKVSDADIKKLADPFAVMFPQNKDKVDAKKQDAAKAEFMREYERIDKAVKPGALLAMPAVWNEVFFMHRAVPKAPSGLGRVEEKSVGGDFDNKPAEFHFGLVLPNGFDPKKRYPLILALHDKANREEKVSGGKYLEEVWMKLPKEERDKYILVAPTMGPASAGKEHRVQWGSPLHFYSIYACLTEVLDTLPIDRERMYLDGSGEGGEFAWQVALYRPHMWAAVGIRSALPRVLQLLPNGGSLPISVHLRTGSPAHASPNRAKFDQERAAVATIEVKEHPAAEKPVRTMFASDPIQESTPAIAAFFAGKTRNLGPKKVTYLADTADFRDCYWVRLVTYESGDKPGEKFAKITAVVDDAANAIDVKSDGVEIFKLYLNDRVVDLDKPVKILVNGKPHTERQIERSLDAFLRYYAGNRIDPGLQPTAILEVKVPAADAKPESSPATPK